MITTMTNQINNGGFTIEQIYSLVGKYDYTSSISLRKGADDEALYGNNLVGVFVFSKSERDNLELKIVNSVEETQENIKFCCFLPEMSEEKAKQLKEQGINTKDIVAISWIPRTSIENTYPSHQKRTLIPIRITPPISSKKDNKIWTYEFLKRLKQNGVGLCPDEENRYLAYKLLFAPNELSLEEKRIIYNEDGNINDDVSFELFKHKFSKFSISRKEMKKMADFLTSRYNTRISILTQELKKAGTSLEKLKNDNPEMANFLIAKVQDFHQKRFNVKGKYPLYLDLKGYVHILLRHIEDAQFKNKFEDKTKFQYDESDIEIVMNVVLSLINKDYQEFKESKPSACFVKKDENAYYFNGDYYAIIVNPDGCIASFYKRGTKKHITKKYYDYFV